MSQIFKASSGGAGDITSIVTPGGTATAEAGVINFNGAGGTTITASENTVVVTSSGSGGFTWNNVAGTTQSLAPNNGYILNNAASATLTLPVTCAFGATISVLAGPTAVGSPVYTIAQNAGQTIYSASGNTTTGVTGSITTNATSSAVTFVCITANTNFNILNCETEQVFTLN